MIIIHENRLLLLVNISSDLINALSTVKYTSILPLFILLYLITILMYGGIIICMKVQEVVLKTSHLPRL